MKKRIIAVIVILAVLVALFFIGTGFQKRMDVVLVDYSVSEDGTEITLDVGIPTSTESFCTASTAALAASSLLIPSL